jgi:hypothetical protein
LGSAGEDLKSAAYRTPARRNVPWPSP